MKKIMVLLLAVMLCISLSACNSNNPSVTTQPTVSDTTGTEEKTELTLWTYPVGGWANPTKVADLITAFHNQYPQYHVSVEYLDYDTGDDKVEAAIENGQKPDLVLEGPERLVANWGSRGLMADLSDLWEDKTADQIFEPVRAASRYHNGEYYIFPVSMTTHCMAINRDMFEAAGALQYIDEENRTWSTQDFIHAVEALQAYGQEEIGDVYCGGQGGDQGTRALVTNLYGGAFTNKEHTAYVFNSDENIQALELLYDIDGIDFQTDMSGGDSIDRFCNGEVAMTFCWNVSIEVERTMENPSRNFDILPMTFPTDSGEPCLQGGIWGFGIFDNGDVEKLEAAKTFIRFMTTDDAQYSRAVLTSTQFPVRDMKDLYANDELMAEYSLFGQYMGDYYQITPGWADARTAWWNMLQEIGAGENIAETVEKFEDMANEAAGGS